MKKKMITFRLEPELDKQVQRIAQKNGLQKSEQYRNIIRYYFSDWMRKIFK